MDGRFLIGYARVSTDEQELRLQVDALRRYGIPEDRIFTEKVSGKSLNNRLLKKLLKHLREGDRIVVWKLDRLGRSVKDMVHTVERIERAGADLVSLTEGVDTSSAMGRFFFHVIAAIAELERGMISERTRAGMAARKAADPDVKWGAKHWFHDFPKRQDHLRDLYRDGLFGLGPRPTEKHPKALALVGMTPAGLMNEANAADPKARKIASSESIRRWLREGAPGLQTRETSDG